MVSLNQLSVEKFSNEKTLIIKRSILKLPICDGQIGEVDLWGKQMNNILFEAFVTANSIWWRSQRCKFCVQFMDIQLIIIYHDISSRDVNLPISHWHIFEWFMFFKRS